MPATPREFEVSYGGFTVGGNTDYELDGFHAVRTGDQEGSVEFSFLVAEDTEAEFVSACQAVEAAFRKPYQDLVVSIDGTEILALRQSGNTALDPRPEVTKRGQEGDSARSRVYTVRVSYGLPANTGAEPEPGLRESRVDVRYTPARKRTVVLSGTFTAVPANDARAQYEDRIDAFAAAVLTAIGGTYDLVDESAEHDTNDRLLTFSRSYEEIILDQGPVTDDPDIKRLTLSVTSLQEGPGDTPEAGRLVTLTLRSEVWLDATRTRDRSGKFLELRDWYVDQIENTLGSGDLAVVSEDVEIDKFENKFTVTMTAKGVATSETIIENQVSVEDSLQPGVELVPAWNGDEYARYRYQGHATKRRTITQTKTILGRVSVQDASKFEDREDQVGQDGKVQRVEGIPDWLIAREDTRGGKWEEVDRRARVTPRRLGIKSETLDVSEVRFTLVLEFWRPIESGPAITPSVTRDAQGAPR